MSAKREPELGHRFSRITPIKTDQFPTFGLQIIVLICVIRENRWLSYALITGETPAIRVSIDNPHPER